MPESESLLGRTLNTLSGAAKKRRAAVAADRRQHLPDFKVVRRSLGLGGMGAVSEPNGWFIKGFLLPKPAMEKANHNSIRGDPVQPDEDGEPTHHHIGTDEEENNGRVPEK